MALVNLIKPLVVRLGFARADSGVHIETLPRLLDWLRLVFREFYHDRCPMRAAVLTYATLLGLVPLLAVIFMFFDVFGGSEWLAGQMKPFLIQTLAGGVGERAVATLDQLLVKAPVGALGGVGFIFLVYAGTVLLTNLEETFNYIWKVTRGRTLFARFRNYWVAVTLVPLLIIASLVATSSIGWNRTLTSFLTPGIYALLRSWGFPLFLEWLGFFLLFTIVPNVRVKVGPAALGALLGAVLWETAKRLYFIYTSMSVGYSLLYGAFAVLPLFLVWLNITFMILLFSLEAVYVTQHFTELRRFIGGTADQYSLEGIAINLLVDVAQRQLSEKPALRLNTAAARFDFQAIEVKRLIRKLAQAKIIIEPSSDDEFLHLARDPEKISLAQIIQALGKIPPAGLPEEVKKKVQEFQEKHLHDLQQVSLHDLATPSAVGVAG